MNLLILKGNLTRDCETRFLPSGDAAVSGGVAVNRKWVDKASGQVKEEVCFLDFTCFGKRGEALANHFRKGSPILLTGRLRHETWSDKQTGDKRSKHTMVVDQWEFCGREKVAAADAEPPAPPQPQQPSRPASAGGAQRRQQDAVPGTASPFEEAPPNFENVPDSEIPF